MIPHAELSGLKRVAVWEHALRFGFGGLVSVGAALVSHRWGPEIGGLLLAFPAILPASLTLVKEHDGRRQAASDARGARLGALALAGFALTALALANVEASAALTLFGALAAWMALAVALWALVEGRRR